MPSKLIMNPTMGRKWFIFYARVRPCFIIFSAFVLFINAVQYPSFYTDNILLLITVLLAVAQFILAIRIFLYSYKDYEDFVKLANCSLILDIFTIPYNSSIQLYYEKACDPGPTAIIGTVILLLTYLLWYRPNIKYFRKRLFRAPTVVTPQKTVQANHISTADNVPHAPNTARSDLQSELPIADPVAKTSKRRYCSNCGGMIDPITKKCSGCEKQYFKGVPWKAVLVVILVLLLICSLSANVLLYMVCDDFSSEKSELTEKLDAIQAENEVLSQELKDSNKQFNEINRLVVFVEDDGTNLYHKFECEKFVGNSFWAYNIDAAIEKGYEPCSLCSKSTNKPTLSWNEEFDYRMIAHAVGDDYEISTADLKNLPAKEREWLASQNIVFICSTWTGRYHNMFCDRLIGTCRVTVRPLAESEGYRACLHCLK